MFYKLPRNIIVLGLSSDQRVYTELYVFVFDPILQTLGVLLVIP